MLEKLAKQTAVYGISTIVVRFLSYLLTPYYTRVFGQETYGVVTDIYALIPLALTLLTCMLAAAHMPRALQWLLGNRLMRFLSAISFNLYIWHQFLAVEMARSWFPDTLHSDTDLQRAYTLLCLSVAVVAAMLATFGLEQPVTKLAKTWEEKRS